MTNYFTSQDHPILKRPLWDLLLSEVIGAVVLVLTSYFIWR